MIHVIATIQVRGGRRDEFLAEFVRIVPAVRAEAGCIEYGPAVDVPTDIPAQELRGETVVTVIEKWESLAALDDHLAAAHMTEYRDRVRHLVESVALHVLESAVGPSAAK